MDALWDHIKRADPAGPKDTRAEAKGTTEEGRGEAGPMKAC
jgi:hypothetical protein